MTRISSGEDALVVAAKLAAQIEVEATSRDEQRLLAHDHVQALKESGLLALSIPVAYGGIEAPATVLAEVFRLLAHADPSVAQIPQSHFTFLEALRLQGTEPQKRFFYGLVAGGALFANAQSERGPHPIDVDTTTLARRPSGDFVLTGRKYYSTGALFADWVTVRASVIDDPGDPPTSSTPKAVAFVPGGATGLTVVDDWDGMGQRTTASGTVILDDVDVPAARVVPYSPIFASPTVFGARAQLLHAAIDVGIATGAFAVGLRQAERARPHFEAKVAAAVDDPTLAPVAGELAVTVRAAEVLLTDAARQVDAATANPTDETTAAASIAVAIAKVAAVRASLHASTGLFDFGGTRSASREANLSRFWRDARTHTLHDPTRWKLTHIGRYFLAGVAPPRHGQL